jgi:hypothetical protein
MYRKILGGLLIAGTTLVYADENSSLYVGLGLGYGLTSAKVTTPTSLSTIQKTQFGGNLVGGLYLGYDFNHYIGIQADYNYIANVNLNVNLNSATGFNSTINDSQQLVDLGVTGHLPLELLNDYWLSGYYLYGRLGLGYNIASFQGGNVAFSDNNGSLPGNASTLIPVYAVGFEYGSGQVGFRLEYDYLGSISATSSTNNRIDVSNQFVMISTLYHF